MRVVFATAEYVTERNFDGGLANYIHRAALGLLSLGHQPIVVVASDRDEKFVHRGVEVHRVRVKVPLLLKALERATFSAFKMSFYLFQFGRSLNRRVREIHQEAPVDIVQFSHLGGASLFKSVDAPAVVRLSSYTPLARALGGYEFTSSFQIRQQEFFEKRALLRADAIFGPSVMISGIVAKELSRKVEIIESPFVIDTHEHDDSVYRNAVAGKRYLLYFGTLSVLKGIPTLAQISRELLSRYPDLHMVFVGKEQGTFQGCSQMEYVYRCAGPHRDRIVYLGPLNHRQLYPVLINSQAVVLPSRIDNFPNTCLEAMAHGKMVIGTRGTSFEQLIDDGVSGFLAGVDAPADLLATVTRALDLAPQQRELMQAKAKQRMQRLRPEVIVPSLLQFYQNTIEQKGA